MITEIELIRQTACLKLAELHDWIEAGMLKPHRDESGYLFDDLDQARVALMCDLRYHMGLGPDSLPVIISLVDQLHETRHSLRAMSTAVSEQPDEIRVAITSRVKIMLAAPRR